MTVPPKASRREWIGLAVIALPCILATMDLTVLNLAVPHISTELKPTSSQLLWILDIYGFMIAGALITMGTLGDRIGRRKLLLIGATFFGVASALAAFSKTAEMLIFTRALLGLAGATLAPSTLSLIRNMFLDDKQRTTAIGIWVTCFSVGAAIGPLLGGLLLEHFWWGSVFLLNVPVMVLLLILGPILLPEFKDTEAGKLDLLSAGMSLSAVLLIIYGLKKIAEHGFYSVPVASITAGLIVGTFFIRRQRLLSDPLIDLNLFRSSSFSASLALNMLGCFMAFGIYVFLSQHLQLILGLTPLQAGLYMMPSSLAFIAGSLLTPPLAKRFSPGSVIATGLIFAAIGFGMLIPTSHESSLVWLVLALSIYSTGITPIFILSTDLIISSAPPERAGAAASISETCTEFGGAVGMAVLGSIGTAMYRAHVGRALPENLPLEAAEAARATLGGAVAVAQNLPGADGLAILTPARDAFAHAIQMVSVLNVVISLGLAVLAAVMIKRPPSAD